MKLTRALETLSVALVCSGVGLLAMMAWSYGPDLVPGYGDLTEYFPSLWANFAEAIRNGHLPWWVEHQDLGFPFMANPQVSIFYLPNYLLLLPRGFGIQSHLASAVFIHAAGVYLLMRSSGVGAPIASLVTLAVSTSGVILGMHSMATAIHTFAWAPWVMFILKGRRRSPLGVVLLGICGGQSLLAGAWDLWITVFPLLLVCYRKELVAGIRVYSGAALIAIGICLPQMILTLPNLSRTIRTTLALEHSFKWSGGLHSLTSLLSPNVVLSTLGTTPWGNVYGDRIAWALILFPGAMALVALPFVVVRTWKRDRILMTFVTAQLIVACMGSIPKIVEFFVSIHIKSPIRYPDKLLLGLSWFLIVICWTELYTWLRFHRRFLQKPQLLYAAVWISSWPLIMIFCRDQMLSSRFPDRIGTEYVQWRQLYEYTLNVDLAILICSTIVLLGAVAWFRKKPRIALGILAFSSIFELSLNGTFVGVAKPLTDLGHWSGQLGEIGYSTGRVWRSTYEMKNRTRESKAMDSSITKIKGFAIYDLAWDLPLSVRGGWSWLDGVNVLAPFYSRKYSEIARFPIQGVAEEVSYRTSTPYVVGSRDDLKWFKTSLRSCFEDKARVVICTWKDAQPKVVVRQSARFYQADSVLVEYMLAKEKDRSSVYFKDPSLPNGTLQTFPGPAPRILSDPDSSGAERRFALEPGAPGWLTMATTWDPGWRAWVDGNEVRVLKADYALCGIALPAGARLVEFRYRPPNFMTGLILSIVVLLLGVGVACRFNLRGH